MPITLDGTTGIDAPLGTAATPSYGNTTATTTGLYFPTSTTLGLSTNGTAALTIDASQNVGIGTSSPNTKFVVSNAGAAGLEIAPTGFSSAPSIVSYNRSGAAYTQLTLDGSVNVFAISGTERARFDTSGNLLIGRTTTAALPDGAGSTFSPQLEVGGTPVAGIMAITTDGTNNRRVGLFSDNTNSLIGISATTSTSYAPFVFRINGSENMRIDTSGNVGIGVTSPAYKLDVNGTIQSRNASYPVLQLYNSGLASNPYYRIAYDAANNLVFNYVNSTYTSSTEQMRITSAGGVSFGSSGTAYGTSGQVLTSAGNAPPTWTTISTSASGTLIRAPRVLTSGTSYTTPANCNNIFIEAIGGGGGGGSQYRSISGTGLGGGGGPGIYATKYVSVSPNTTYTYSIGAGGAGSIGGTNSSSGGGNTSITIGGTTYTAGGGGGVAGPGGNNQNSNPGASGTATNMDTSITPISAGQPYGGMTLSPYGVSSVGAWRNMPMPTVNGNYDGLAAYGFGGGGGGNYTLNTTGGPAGGAGYQGFMRIWEYT